MKKVRFYETLAYRDEMESSDCHSPRPFIRAQILPTTVEKSPDFYSRPLVHLDPVEQYERSNSFPYSITNKTRLANDYDNPSRFQPSNDLDLSMLDGQEPRRFPISEILKCPVLSDNLSVSHQETPQLQNRSINMSPILHSVENVARPQVNPAKDNSFFLRRDNLHKLHVQDSNPVRKQFQGLSLLRENNARASKEKIQRDGIPNPFSTVANKPDDSLTLSDDENCCCHHCSRQTKENIVPYGPRKQQNTPKAILHSHGTQQPCPDVPNQGQCMMACHLHYQHFSKPPCNHYPTVHTHDCRRISTSTSKPLNAVDKKRWAIEKFEKNKKSECTDVEKPSAIAKEKREPTVADLFKIIKLQNEQLQLLQEKVDKCISSSNTNKATQPLQNYVTERVALKAVDSDPKISIGVMTSFEMVHTSTVINKEITSNNMGQVQCNRSQISVKEVALCQPGSQNFLDGILPVGSTVSETTESLSGNISPTWQGKIVRKPQPMQEEKTLNECSLFNVQVDNATTPLISPEQTMYLDVKDYSDSDSTGSDQSNVGWTYYSKVMTHVNNVLQDSDLPSSASALFRNTRQKCVQMHIDKTNISVTKRVKFGDDLQGLPQPQFQQLNQHMATTDTSLKMNLLAAKYLKMAPQKQRAVMNAVVPNDMSFATRRYMERHEILQGLPAVQHNDYGGHKGSPATYEMPKFLDITALKQQPKLL